MLLRNLTKLQINGLIHISVWQDCVFKILIFISFVVEGNCIENPKVCDTGGSATQENFLQ